MTLYELWVMTTYVGKVFIHDDQGLKIYVDRLTPLILDENHEWHKLQNAEVEYFDCHTSGSPYGVILDIKLKEKEK